MATHSISVSLEASLLADLDAHSTNRSEAVSEAIRQRLRHRQVAELQQAYDDLSRLQGGDLKEATGDGEAVERLHGCTGALQLATLSNRQHRRIPGRGLLRPLGVAQPIGRRMFG